MTKNDNRVSSDLSLNWREEGPKSFLFFFFFFFLGELGGGGVFWMEALKSHPAYLCSRIFVHLE